MSQKNVAFAKLFDTEEFGQILVINDTNAEGQPCVRFSVQPPGLGVCSVAPAFGDGDDAADRADELFARVDEAFARERAQEIFKMTASMMEDSDDE